MTAFHCLFSVHCLFSDYSLYIVLLVVIVPSIVPLVVIVPSIAPLVVIVPFIAPLVVSLHRLFCPGIGLEVCPAKSAWTLNPDSWSS